MLDYAATLPGLTIEVIDEGDYWNSRDAIALARNFLEDATMLAGLANALGESVQAPIRERGDFGELVERFEAQSSKYHDTVEILKRIVKKDSQDS